MQVGYISQKYTWNKYTWEKYFSGRSFLGLFAKFFQVEFLKVYIYFLSGTFFYLLNIFQMKYCYYFFPVEYFKFFRWNIFCKQDEDQGLCHYVRPTSGLLDDDDDYKCEKYNDCTDYEATRRRNLSVFFQNQIQNILTPLSLF